MRVSANGEVTLEKSEATRMMESVYLVKRLSRDLPESPEKARVLAAADVIAATARQHGAKHFNEDGTLKDPVARKAEAATDAKTAKGKPAP